MMPQRSARFGFACLAVHALSAAPSRADDSMATLGAGGLMHAKVRAWEEYLSYVITSGANWAGPIGSKGDTALVSFCGDGVRKIGPTTFEMIAKDYTPRRDIDVLLVNTHSTP
ncbi:MAG: DUF4424 family protein [Hyphomicrobiales bacterium]|nr:DUF4424 family protein [Hyphomicrobiales bacterium]